MKEYTAQEMKKLPFSGLFWIREVDGKEYFRYPVRIDIFFDGWRCIFVCPEFKISLKDVADNQIFYGPIEKPGVPE